MKMSMFYITDDCGGACKETDHVITNDQEQQLFSSLY